MTELSDLPPTERARRYRDLAEEAERHAKETRGGHIRDAYLVMASQWRKLAEETESTERRGKTMRRTT